MAENPIQGLLDQRRFPWRESQAALTERGGELTDPWFNRERIVFVDNDPPLLPGLLRPFHFEPTSRDDPSMPPLQLWGWAWARRKPWLSSRAMASLNMIRESLEPALGRPEANDTSNSRSWRWQFGRAWIEIFCFPPLLALPPTGGEIPDQRDPKVDQSCWIKLYTGYRPPCAEAERAAIGAFEPWITLRGSRTAAWIIASPPIQEVLEYTRKPCPGFERTIGRLGRTRDGETFIFGAYQLHIVPVAEVDHVYVDRVEPERGGEGYSALFLACRGSFGDRPVRRLFLTSDAEPNVIDDIGARVADWLARPCVQGPDRYGV